MAVGRSAPSRDFSSLAFVLGGVAATALYATGISPSAAAASFTVVGLGSVVALFAGPRWHRAEPRRPWQLLASASVVFLIGALLRPWAVEQSGPSSLLADAFTVPGYLLMILALAGMLRARGAVERQAIIDGLIVCVGAALLSILLLAIPAASIAQRPAMVSALAGLYPLFDVALLMLVVNLAFTTAARRPSFMMLVGAVVLLLAGDLAYAIIGVSGHLTGSPLLNLPFLLAYTMIGATALHPSMVELARSATLPVQAWSWPRLLMIGSALAVPFVLTAVGPHRSMATRLVLIAGGATMVALLLVRAVSAVQDYAAAQRRYEHQATHDPLTGLPNRLMLSATVQRMLATNERGSGEDEPPAPQPAGERLLWVFFLDLDGFKLVNDSWGHDAGDQLIIEVARRLRDTVPAPATVARVGGDEFIVVHLGSRPEATQLVDKIMGCLAEPLQVFSVEVVITASVGIAGAPIEASAGGDGAAAPSVLALETAAVTAESLMRDADTAMYQAKSEGRGKWLIFDASMHERVRERVEIEVALRHALAQGQLHLAYQPIVELSTGRLLAAEALLRWDHPIRGSVPPAAFIPIAEDTGLVSAIGRWVMHEALRQLSAWRTVGAVTGDFWISINVSPRQLRDATLPGAVAEALVRYAVPATAVVLEITESVMVDASTVTERVMSDLRKLGVRIVVDDFGTGFSALGYLRRHPVTGVKIDRAFVGGLGVNAEDEEIVRAVVAMSGALGLTVVAEGVETQTQRDVLADFGVVLGQGQLWGSAVAPQRFTERWAALA
jgi:diguanylate cyclase (GGDEF)-like protein